jgi:hypothetical protein
VIVSGIGLTSGLGDGGDGEGDKASGDGDVLGEAWGEGLAGWLGDAPAVHAEATKATAVTTTVSEGTVSLARFMTRFSPTKQRDPTDQRASAPGRCLDVHQSASNGFS